MRFVSRLRLGRMAVLAGLGLVVVSTACQTTRQTRHVEESGFLGDYSRLHEGEGDEALLVYINPRADFPRYDDVLIDSVTFWHDGETKVSEEDQQMLTDHLYLALHTKLQEKGFDLVDQPGPGVLRLRAAITQAKGAHTVANAMTSVIPQTRLVATLVGLATDTAILVGEASMELEATDSQSGERLAAAVDERIGTKAVRGAFSEWREVTDAFDFWAERTATRLQELHDAN